MRIGRGHRSDCGSGVMPGHGYHGDGTEPCFRSDFRLQDSNFCPGLHYFRQDVRIDTETGQQRLLELTGILVHHAGSGGVRVFAHHIAGEQI